ncbi:MAG TPA: hypothetical protein VMU94_25190 [Streptosporangiaceae bacterium]|nr:hypothetical protein [Streptosporangiaceae bacterium]
MAQPALRRRAQSRLLTLLDSLRPLHGLAGRLSVLVLAAACSGGQSGPAALRGAAHRQAPQQPMVLQATWAPYQLPSAISGEVAVPDSGRLLIAGGTASRGAAAGVVTRLNPVTGQEGRVGKLALPVTDAAAVLVHGQLVVFGGRAGQDASGGRAGQDTSGVQALAPGGPRAPARHLASLPLATSGLTAATTGSTTYLVGGARGASRLAAVLRTTDGAHFAAAASLPVPVADAATVASAGQLWVFGGTTSAGLTNVIQRVDLASGRAKVVGRLPRPLAAASAFVLGGRIFVAGGLTIPAAGQHGSRPAGRPSASGTVLSVDPAHASVRAAGLLPTPVAHAASAVVGGTAYLVGGTDGRQPVPAVVTLRLVPVRDALPGSGTGSTLSGAAARQAERSAPWLAPAKGSGHLAPGSRPSALPADVLVADHLNNRLVIIDPRGRVRWVFPRPGDLAPGQTFRVPDDAFFSPDGRYIIATQEDDQVISIIDVATSKIVYRYGKPGTPGMGPNRVDNPDDALLTPSGDIIAADIKNCRVIVIAPPAHRPLRVIGQTTNGCAHDPPRHFGSPNGAFPMSNGGYVVTEINGDWADSLDLNGHVRWSANPPGVLYPSDTNEVYPGRFLTADYSDPGQVVEFTPGGRLLWRFGGLNQPSLAIPMPNGDVLINDDFNHRIIVVNPANNHILWQYGHTGIAGRSPGYLNDPDGLDLVPPDSFLIRHATTMRQP